MAAELGGVERGAGPAAGVGGQRLRALEAEQRRVGRLAGGGVLAGRLAEVGGRALDVQHVVDNLEGEADLAAEDADGGDRRRRRRRPSSRRRPLPPQSARRSCARACRPAWRRRTSAASAPSCGRTASRSMAWPPTMPAAPAAVAMTPMVCSLRSDDGRMRVVRLARQPRERLGQQAVTDEDRLPLAEADVGGRAAAPQVVVVHRRQVVVDERVGVNQLEGARPPAWRAGTSRAPSRGWRRRWPGRAAGGRACRRRAARSAGRRRARPATAAAREWPGPDRYRPPPASA